MKGKRLLDLALMLPLVPLFGLVVGVLALLVLVLDGRPLFFTQPRLGQGRRVFQIFKLRTMTCEPDMRARRPTRLGGLLRHHGLDELPQLFNVLIGDMSLVGPRPLTPDDAERLISAHPPLAARFEVPPGITGLAQVCQARGAALTARLDAEYARNRSATVDIGILLRTTWMNVVGKRRGARPLPPHLVPR
ncbi:MAG TPA: sugar transferase [Myxococcaceae bacterium]|nr:sugar transferase [Myxococcaceae bacterium]